MVERLTVDEYFECLPLDASAVQDPHPNTSTGPTDGRNEEPQEEEHYLPFVTHLSVITPPRAPSRSRISGAPSSTYDAVRVALPMTQHHVNQRIFNSAPVVAPDNIGINHPHTAHSGIVESVSQQQARSTTESDLGSRRNSRGRPAAWWKVDCFNSKHTSDGDFESTECINCGKTWTGKEPSASVLGDHVYDCDWDDDTRKRLVQDSHHIQTRLRRSSQDERRRSNDDDLSQADQPRPNHENGRGRGRKRFRTVSGRNLSNSGTWVPRIDECSDEEAKKISLLVVQCLVEMGWSFSALDSKVGNPNAFRQLLSALRPGYADTYLPSRHVAVRTYLNILYQNALRIVRTNLEVLLNKCYGTVIFDGWDDVTMSSVVNVLIRVEGNGPKSRKTFFLESVFTGHDKITAKEYVRIVEQVLERFGGMSRICGVTSDNAKACVNARKALSKKYPGVIGIQDQAHVADLLMKDIGKIPWVAHVLKDVNMIVSETRSKRKLLSFLRGEVSKFNKGLPRNRAAYLDRIERNRDKDPFDPEVLFPPLAPTAVMLKRPAPTRFASTEGTLESFLRTREVLRRVVDSDEFHSSLFESRTTEQAAKKEDYVELIFSKPFQKRVVALHNIFRVRRRYLREFDKEVETSLADVLNMTESLEKALRSLPVCEFLTEERKHEVLDVFLKRKDGPLGRQIQVRLLEDIHVAATLLDPSKCPKDPSNYIERLWNYIQKYVRSAVFPDVQKQPGTSREAYRLEKQQLEAKRQYLCTKLLSDYKGLQPQWKISSRLMAADPFRAKSDEGFRASALRYWTSRIHRKDCVELCEMAARLLSVSPSSCAAERSFSAQGRIRNKARNRLLDENVRKLIFCYWNGKFHTECEQQRLAFWRSVCELEEEDGADILGGVDSDGYETDEEDEGDCSDSFFDGE